MPQRSHWLVILLLTGLSACVVRPPRARVPLTSRLTASGSLRITVDAWARISANTGAIAVTSQTPANLPHAMTQINRHGLPRHQPVDLVYVVDTTGSMEDDIGSAKQRMRSILADLTAWNPDRRVGIVAYKDRGDDFTALVVLPLDTDAARIEAGINWLLVGGGGDLREHVYAALDTALTQQTWREGASRHIVLIGDAPPHEDYADDPRTYASVMATAASLGVKIHTIGINCDAKCQGELAAEEDTHASR